MPELLPLRIKPVFLLGSRATFLREDKIGLYDCRDAAEQDQKTDAILEQLRIDTLEKTMVRTEDDLIGLDAAVDVFLVFVHTMHKFAALELLAQKEVPILLACEAGSPGDALDVYESLACFPHVSVTLDATDIERQLRIITAVRQVRDTKICLFDTGKRAVESAAWHRNPLLDGTLNVETVDLARFAGLLEATDRAEAERLADQWLRDAELHEPTRDDVVGQARLFLAMKTIIEEMRGQAAYVLWCGQFADLIDGKMCFAVARLNDAGYLTGCWRGENMLPMLILHGLTGRPVFFGEVHTFQDGILSVRHCAVPTRLAASRPVLKRWRDADRTVTGYCRLPAGDVTILNAGQGDKLIALAGEVFDTRDIGGENCRTTVYVKVADTSRVSDFRGRELALAYGNHVADIIGVGRRLDVPVN